MKSVLCEMKICTLRNEICTLRNEYQYFPEKFFVKKLLRTYYSTTIMTATQVFFVVAAYALEDEFLILDSSSTATEGISNMVSRKRRSRKLGPQNRKT